MALSFFITPKGTMCGITIVPQINGAQVSFGGNVESFGSPQEAQSYLGSLIMSLNQVNTTASAGSILDLRPPANVPVITGTSIKQIVVTYPSTGDTTATTASSCFSVYGFNFAPGIPYFLGIDDNDSNPDTLGFKLQLVYVAPNELITSGTGIVGDAATASTMNLFLEQLTNGTDGTSNTDYTIVSNSLLTKLIAAGSGGGAPLVVSF